MAHSQSPVVTRAPGTEPAGASAFDGAGTYRMFVRDLVLPCRIGVHPHERETAQRVRVNVELAVEDACAATGDDIAAVVSYEDVVFGVRAIADRGGITVVTNALHIAGELAKSFERERRLPEWLGTRLRGLPGGEELADHLLSGVLGDHVRRRRDGDLVRVAEPVPAGPGRHREGDFDRGSFARRER